MVDRDALILLALESPSRVIAYDEIAQRLQICEEDIEAVLIEAIACGSIVGKVDAESQRLLVDATAPPVVTPELVQKTLDGLQQMESRLNAELYGSSRAYKRSRSPVQ